MFIDLLLVLLSVFLFLCCVFWSYLLIYMLWYKVPLISTSKKVIDEALNLAQIQPDQTVFELGCGWAPFLFAAAKAEPKATYIGIEVIRFVLWVNKIRAQKQAITFKAEDFFKVDLTQADVIYCYLWDTIMADIYAQKWTELKPGTKLITFEFPLKKLAPDKKISFGKSTLYLYVKP